MISIVIPAFDAASTIDQQLDALAAQVAAHDCEVIVADNGSTDDTAARAERWDNRLPLRVVDASARKGPAAARNVGAEIARGDLLVFADADDVVLPGWLDAWRSRQDTLEAGGGPVASFSSGAPLPDPRAAAAAAPTHMGFLPYALGANLAARRDVFETVGGFPEDRRTAEDVVFSWRLQLAGHRLTFVREAVVAKRRAPTTNAALRQYYQYGLSDPWLYREFRALGMTRPAAWTTTKSYLGIVARLPLLTNDDQRRRWTAQTGRRGGRIAGSISSRTLYL